MNGLNSESVDLIYLDPPFNSKRLYNAAIGSRAEGSQFKDTWKWSDVNEYLLDIIANDFPELADYIEIIGRVSDMSMKSYIFYMAQRVIQLHRILKPTGSIYYHCDPTAGHYVKLMLDCVFGKSCFCNEIIWNYAWGVRTDKRWNKKHDLIFMYNKTKDFFFDASQVLMDRQLDESSKKRLQYKGAMIKDRNKRGESKKALPTDVWYIPTINAMSKERTGYPTQKPLALLERIIKASCPEGGIVLDPFCGCATTCVAAQRLKRHWIGIDIEDKAIDLLTERLEQDGRLIEEKKGNKPDLCDRPHLRLSDQDLAQRIKGVDYIILNCEKDKNKLPHRTDVETKDINEPKTKAEIKKFLYAKQQHKCNGCNCEIDIKLLEIDHVIPKAVGGGDYLENYQLLCSNCNRIKGDRPMEFLLQRIDIIRKLRIKKEY